MTTVDEARDGADAVRRFAAELGRPPERIQAKLDGADGMAGLCAVEQAVSHLWAAAAKELVWLTRDASVGGDLLHLQAFASDGEVLGAATFRLAPADV